MLAAAPGEHRPVLPECVPALTSTEALLAQAWFPLLGLWERVRHQRLVGPWREGSTLCFIVVDDLLPLYDCMSLDLLYLRTCCPFRALPCLGTCQCLAHVSVQVGLEGPRPPGS